MRRCAVVVVACHWSSCTVRFGYPYVLAGLPVLLVCYSTLGSRNSQVRRERRSRPVLGFLTIIKDKS